MDLDGSKVIEEREWIIATINKESLLTEKIISQAFRAIDVDHSESISMEEFRNAIFKNFQIDEDELNEIIQGAGFSEDSQLSYEDFRRMINQLLFAQVHLSNISLLKRKKTKANYI